MPIINLLGVGSGTFLYHFLILLALEAVAGIALIEWRHTRNPDYRPILQAFVGLLALRIPLLVGGALGPDIIAPLINGMEIASLVLLGWGFLAPILRPRVRKLYLIGGLGLSLLSAVTFLPAWYQALARTPNLMYLGFWQQPFWYAVSILLALAPAVVLLNRPHRGEYLLPIVGFVILSLGSAVLCAGSLFLTAGQSGAGLPVTLTGWGRLVILTGYPFFAIAVYRGALQDMWSYRQELQTVSEEALRQTQELLSLVEISRAIGESLDLDTVLRRVIENVTMALDADRSAIFLTDPDGPETIRLAAQHTPLRRLGRSAEQLTVPLSEQPTLASALDHRKQLVLNAQTDNPRLLTLYDLLGSRKAGPTIVQPLVRQRRVLGALVVGNDRSQRPFEPSKGRLCRSIGGQVAAAIENARLYRDLGAQADQLAELLQSREEEVRRRTAILESIAEGVIVSDKERRIVIANAATEDILGAPRRRILGRSLEQLIGPLASSPEADWNSFVQSDTPLQTIFELENKIVYVNAAPVIMPTGDHLGVVAILRDITKETEAKRAKSEFITAISHELRTPLTAIQGYAELLSKVGDPNETQSRFLQIIQDNVLDMVSLTNDLISISQIERGSLKLTYGEMDLNALIGDVVDSFQGQFEERRLEIGLELDDNLPAIEADPARLQQILENLLSNAIKFTDPGGRVTVCTELLHESEERPQDHCAIRVSDTGIGIPPEEQTRIWKRFYRPSNRRTEETRGLGVGLSVVKSLVEAHGGRVWVDSTMDAGSTFTVLLPISAGGG